MFSVHNRIKLEINGRKRPGEIILTQFEIQQHTFKYCMVKDEVSKKIINYFELNKNGSTTYQICGKPTKQCIGENL